MPAAQPRIAYSYERVSTGQQLSGRGLDRQADMAAAWCERHGFTLDTQLDLTDAGRSAYKGHHISRGALGRFLALAQQGTLPEGSVLLIEAIDRLSRQEPMEALQGIVFALVGSGVEIVDLEDGRTYSRESLAGDGLVWLVLRVKAAHEYSARLSRRVVAHWDQLRDGLRDGTTNHRGKAGGRHPFWLDLDSDGRWQFNDRAEDVRLIFQQLQHSGLTIVAQLLNERGSLSSTGKPWAHHSVRRVALDPAAAGTLRLGLFNHESARAALYRWQLAKDAAQQQGKRFNEPQPVVPDVELIPDHYPAVISEEVFNLVGLRLQQRHHSPSAAGNRRSNALHTFLQGLVTCQHGNNLGATLSRKPGKDHYYLRCRARLSGKGCQCNGKGWRVDEIHPHVVARLSQHLQGEAVLPGQDHVAEQQQLAAQLKLAKQRTADAQHRLNTAAATLEQAVDQNAMLDLLENLSAMVEKRRGEHRAATADEARLADRLAQAKASTQPVDELNSDPVRQLLQAIATNTATQQDRARLHRVLQQADLQVVLDDSNPDQLRVGMRIGNAGQHDWQPLQADVARIVLHMGGSDLVVGPRGDAVWTAPSDDD